MFKKANDISEKFEIYCLNKIETLKQYDLVSDYFHFDWLLENKNKWNQIICYIKNNEIVTDIYISIEDFGILIQSDFDFVEKKECLKELERIYEKAFIQSSNYEFLKENGYSEISKESSFNSTYEYNFVNEQVWTKSTEKIFDLRNNFEKHYFPAIELNFLDEIKFEYLSYDELYLYYKNKYNYQIPTWSDNYSIPSIAGFHYFKLETTLSSKFLIAKYKDSIIGVIKIAKIEKEKAIYLNETHECFSYIDIAKPYQEQGVANLMISKLQSFLDKELPLFITKESVQGKTAHIVEKVRKALPNKKIIYYDDLL